MALGSTQPLTEMSARGKGGRCVRLTILPPSCVVMKSGNLKFLEPSGPLQACNGTALPLVRRYVRIVYIYCLFRYNFGASGNITLKNINFS
jgi:hypothetical protein